MTKAYHQPTRALSGAGEEEAMALCEELGKKTLLCPTLYI
eukprot:COSAG06_NODE_254_length_19039_cov_5.465488_3_plen_40_part_00